MATMDPDFDDDDDIDCADLIHLNTTHHSAAVYFLMGPGSSNCSVVTVHILVTTAVLYFYLIGFRNSLKEENKGWWRTKVALFFFNAELAVLRPSFKPYNPANDMCEPLAGSSDLVLSHPQVNTFLAMVALKVLASDVWMMIKEKQMNELCAIIKRSGNLQLSALLFAIIQIITQVLASFLASWDYPLWLLDNTYLQREAFDDRSPSMCIHIAMHVLDDWTSTGFLFLIVAVMALLTAYLCGKDDAVTLGAEHQLMQQQIEHNELMIQNQHQQMMAQISDLHQQIHEIENQIQNIHNLNQDNNESQLFDEVQELQTLENQIQELAQEIAQNIPQFQHFLASRRHG